MFFSNETWVADFMSINVLDLLEHDIRYICPNLEITRVASDMVQIHIDKLRDILYMIIKPTFK